MRTSALALIGLLILLTALGFSSRSLGAATPGACGNDVVDVPDSSALFDFTVACEAHDACFAENAGGSEDERLGCDRDFYAAMLDSCDAMWKQVGWPGLICKLIAGFYYAGVRLGGWLFF